MLEPFIQAKSERVLVITRTKLQPSRSSNAPAPISNVCFAIQSRIASFDYHLSFLILKSLWVNYDCLIKQLAGKPAAVLVCCLLELIFTRERRRRRRRTSGRQKQLGEMWGSRKAAVINTKETTKLRCYFGKKITGYFILPGVWMLWVLAALPDVWCDTEELKGESFVFTVPLYWRPTSTHAAEPKNLGCSMCAAFNRAKALFSVHFGDF